MSLSDNIDTEICFIKKQLNQMLELAYLVYNDLNIGSPIMLPIGNYKLAPKKGESIKFTRLQSKIYKDFNSLIKWVNVLIAREPNRYKREIRTSSQYIIKLLENEITYIYENSIDNIKAKISESLNRIKNVVSSIYSGNDRTIIIPDTSSLLNKVKLEEWKFQDIDEFDIYITPNTLREIDNIKRFHKNDLVMENAQKIDRRFKGYFQRRRGQRPISIIKGKINIEFVAVEPQFDYIFEDLDKNIPDDRFIASAIEIMRNHINSDCYILADDLNLINKAHHFKLPTITLT